MGFKKSRAFGARGIFFGAREGFTLIELLAVIAVMAIVAVMAAGSLQRTSALGTSGSALLDGLSLARQAAMTHNKPVRVWFCRDVTNNGMPVDTILLFWEETAADGSTVRTPVDRELKLHTTVALAENATWSSALVGESEDPKYGEDRPSFRFLSDGSTDLPDGPARTLTLVKRADKGTPELPANFFTLQIDQQTGDIQHFRPQ